MLDRIVREGLLAARAAYGFFPARADGDDVVLDGARFPMLRQQRPEKDDAPTLSLADFVAPGDAGRSDSIGAFALTAGIGAEDLVRDFEVKGDDYSALLVKALADRLAEASAEWLHRRVRGEWGHPDPAATAPEDLLRERFRGIRPAFGYAACPDHSEKRTLFSLLDAEAAGLSLTESCAMRPAASVAGLYFHHPESRYFSVGRVDRDQVESYARRKRVPVEEAERWLSPNLAYDPGS